MDSFQNLSPNSLISCCLEVPCGSNSRQGRQSKLDISPSINEIAPLSVELEDMKVLIILLEGVLGNCGTGPLMKCLICKYLKKGRGAGYIKLL